MTQKNTGFWRGCLNDWTAFGGYLCESDCFLSTYIVSSVWCLCMHTLVCIHCICIFEPVTFLYAVLDKQDYLVYLLLTLSICHFYSGKIDKIVKMVERNRRLNA